MPMGIHEFGSDQGPSLFTHKKVSELVSNRELTRSIGDKKLCEGILGLEINGLGNHFTLWIVDHRIRRPGKKGRKLRAQGIEFLVLRGILETRVDVVTDFVQQDRAAH